MLQMNMINENVQNISSDAMDYGAELSSENSELRSNRDSKKRGGARGKMMMNASSKKSNSRGIKMPSMPSMPSFSRSSTAKKESMNEAPAQNMAMMSKP